MSEQFESLHFDREQFITLNEGFDRVGRFMFPTDWIGHEALAWPETSSQSLKEERDELVREFERCNHRARTLRKTDMYGVDGAEYTEHQSLTEQAEVDRAKARERLDQFGQTFDAHYVDAMAYDRRRSVEQHLCKIIMEKKLNVHLGHGFSVDMERWFDSDRFHMSFAFSYVLAPITYGNRRRFPAYFSKQKFNAWAIHFERHLTQFRLEPLEEQIFRWFLTYRTDCLENSRKVRIEDAQTQCQQYFEGANCKQNSNAEFSKMFRSVWTLLSTAEMKQKGRKPKVG